MISPAPGPHKLTRLKAEVRALLAGGGIGNEVLEAFDAAAWQSRTGTLAPLPGFADHLENSALGRALHAAAGELCWRQNPNYRDPGFLDRYRYCELVGPLGHYQSAVLAAGLLTLAPHTLYPAHAHPAAEIYFVLSEESEWQMGDAAWRVRISGDRVEHPPGVRHAMRTRAQPLLALYLWRGAIGEAARLC